MTLRAEMPEDDFAAALTAADKDCHSWREKLDFVRERLAAATAPLSPEQLVDVAVYLRFLGTGEIACAEDGRHFRPVHHARIALQIQEQLAKLTTPADAYIVRQILPWLPSSAPTFQRPEPLTRIRDIAHRNDIPSDLKRELKHTLQNKLHRCAGPEDLATSAALLQRIAEPGAHYSPAFVEQFKIFHEELKEFFNARSLEERLNILLPTADAEEAGWIRSFLQEKTKSGLSERLSTFELLTKLRRRFLDEAVKHPGLETQELFLTDIGLEDFAFVLLSEMINALEAAETGAGHVASESEPRLPATEHTKSPEALDRSNALPARAGTPSRFGVPPLGGGACPTSDVSAFSNVSPAEAGTPDLRRSPTVLPKAATLRPRNVTGAVWERLLDVLVLTIGNLALSSIEPEECDALEAELRAWRQDFSPADRDQLLRLKATADRIRRLAEDYSTRIMALFRPRVEKLGRALGVADPAIRIFCEAEIRRHIIFQLSKLVTRLLRRIRDALALPAWDVLVSGQSTGRLRVAAALEELEKNSDEPMIVLLEHAEGDEEIPRNVVGLVLAHEIPHLSHLGVRARQARVVFVTCEEEVQELQALQGQMITLLATPESVKWEPGTAPTASTRSPDPGQPVRVPEVLLQPERAWLPLDEIVPRLGGGKADGARRLAELTRLEGAGFKTPPALVVPFGVMEAALRAEPALETEYRQLLGRVNELPSHQFASATERLRDLIQRLHVPDEISSVVAEQFNGQDALIVRSSANCEDLESLAAAGLYESVANVIPANVASAVRTVWTSLWTRRAALSRQQAGLPHEQAHMAVLIQQMLTPDYSFVLHTVNPIDGNPRAVYAEIAVGLGETLASAATRGNPYRLAYDKDSGAVTMLAFANFSQARWPDATGGIMCKTVNYSAIELSRDADARIKLGRRLGAIARFVEAAFHKPQDIEGAVVRDEIYLVQSRPQQGLLSESSR